jgi:PAS domain S-box-containing protein
MIDLSAFLNPALKVPTLIVVVMLTILIVAFFTMLYRLKSHQAQNKKLSVHCELVASIQDVVSDAAYGLDENGLLIFMNAGAERLLGWNTGELAGKNIHEFVQPRNLSKVLSKDFVTSDAYHNANRLAFYEEDILTTRSGQPISVMAYPIPKYKDQAFIGTVVHLLVTEHSCSGNNTLLRQVSSVLALLADSPISVRIVSRHTGQIRYANHSYTKLFGLTNTQVVGRNPITHYQSPDVYEDVKKRLCNDEVIENLLVEIKRDDKPNAWLLATYMNLDYKDEQCSIGWFYDVTDLRRANQIAEDAVKVKSEFLSTMSHEIRTPMNGVIGMINLLAETPLNEEQVDFVNTIKDSSTALLEIINDILDFSKIEAGMLQIVKKEFSIMALVEGCIDLLAPRTQEKNIAFTYFIDPALPAAMIGDAGRIRQVLINLIGNAIKFTEKGRVNLELTQLNSHDGLLTVRFVIEDTGIGMDKATLENLFKPFSQADGSVTRRYGGTGLGLSISKRLIEAMHGEILVSSVRNSGSRFSFDIQLELSEAAKAVQNCRFIAGLNAMVIADSPHEQQQLKRYLAAWEFQAVATDSQSFLNGVTPKDSSPDFAILSVHKREHLQSLMLKLKSLNSEIKLICLSDHELKHMDDNLYAVKSFHLKQSVLFNTILSIYDRRKKQLAVTLDRRAIKALPSANPVLNSGHILVVDDNENNRKVAEKQLAKLGFSVTLANNGEQALQKYTAEHFDLIMMDCHMPVLDGYQTTANIRKIEATKHRHVPIIAMTASAMQGDKEVCLNAGMDDYLTKPIIYNELYQILMKWLP